MTNRAPIARAGFSVGGASDYLRMPNEFTDILSGPDGKLIVVATAGIFISRT